MNDILLAKPQLPNDWVDTSVGESHIVRENLVKIFDLKEYELPNVPHLFEYPSPNGYAPLVKLLEEKHKAPVVITNGAKNGLGAVCYAIKQMDKKTVSLPNPYWCLLPPLIEMHGLEWKPTYEGCDARLLVMPNNPDNAMIDYPTIQAMEQECKDKDIPLIHDSVYYNHIYLPHDYPLKQIGDVQIYSASKSYGLSGIRIGYVVCSNPDFYKFICQYMETMTVGVSLISQVFLYDLMRRMRAYPTLTHKFEGQSAMDLQTAKRIIKQVDPEVLEVPADIESSNGMFLWARKGPKADFQKAKVNVIDGSLFGREGYVRMNLAFDADTMQDIVKRLNSVKE